MREVQQRVVQGLTFGCNDAVETHGCREGMGVAGTEGEACAAAVIIGVAVVAVVVMVVTVVVVVMVAVIVVVVRVVVCGVVYVCVASAVASDVGHCGESGGTSHLPGMGREALAASGTGVREGEGSAESVDFSRGVRSAADAACCFAACPRFLFFGFTDGCVTRAFSGGQQGMEPQISTTVNLRNMYAAVNAAKAATRLPTSARALKIVESTSSKMLNAADVWATAQGMSHDVHRMQEALIRRRSAGTALGYWGCA